MLQLFMEAFIVGIMNVIFGFIISYLLMGERAKDFSHWNTVLLGYFIVGVLIHLFCEFSGLNKMYCKSGNACK